MKFNEFEINKFSGIVNSVVNPDPKTSKYLYNFDVYTKEGALIPRRGIRELLNIQLNFYPTEPTNYEIKKAVSFYSEEYNQEFYILAVNSSRNLYFSPKNFSLERTSFFVYPSFKKINGNYTIVQEWQEINPIAIFNVEHIEAIDEIRYVKCSINTELNLELLDNSFYYWTAIICDDDFNVKSSVLISRPHYYRTSDAMFQFEFGDDYYIEAGDFLILVKNYVDIETTINNKNGKFGFVGLLEDIQLIKTNNGINVLSSNQEVLKIKLDFDKIKIENYQYRNSNNYVYDSNFRNGLQYWSGNTNRVTITEIDNKKVLQFNTHNANYVLYSTALNINYNSMGALVQFRELGSLGANELYLTIYGYNENSEVWEVIFSKKLNDGNYTRILWRWKSLQMDFITAGYSQVKIEFTFLAYSGANNYFQISKIKLYPNELYNLNQTPNSHSNYVKFNEPFQNNGFYIANINSKLFSCENYTSIKENYPIEQCYSVAQNYYPNNSKVLGDRIIAALDGTDECCIFQSRSFETASSSNIVNRSFLINYAVLNRRIKEFRPYFSENNSSIMLDYDKMAYYHINNEPYYYIVIEDGLLLLAYQYNINQKYENLFDYLGYEPQEGLISRWSIQEGQYVANVYNGNKFLGNSIFYPAINGNGVIMYDIIPLGNIIQIDYQGGDIVGLKINRYRDLIILKKSAVFVLDIDTGALMHLSYSDGLINKNALASNGYEIFWLDSNGVKYTNGSQILNISKNLNQDNYISEINKEQAKAYINNQYKTFEFLINDKIYSYPIENPTFNTIKSFNVSIIDIFENYQGNILFLSSDKIYRQTFINENLYSDNNYCPMLIFESNDFDVVNLGENISDDMRIVVGEIFIDYMSKSQLNFELIGDGNVVKSFVLPVSNSRKLERIQISGSILNNLYRSVRLKISRNAYNGSDAEQKSYCQIYSIGFNFILKGITRQFRSLQ